jgi:hypothetical protein
MRADGEKRGFDYYLTPEQLRAYGRKPIALRLEWLYQGNRLRFHLPEHVKKRQDHFRAENQSRSK